MIQPRGACASIGRMAGLRTRTEVTGMIPDNPKRPDVVYTTDDGTEIATDVVTCCPALMPAPTTSNFPTNGRPRLRTCAHQLLAATTALGVARVIRAGLPIRCGPSNRALPTPPNGLPPRPPPGQSRLRPPDHTAALPAANRPANHAANPPGCPEPPPNFLFREPPPGKPVAVEEARCSRGPLVDPGARAFGVFLKASQ